jgi:anaerobic ribonucleoside-triphosphate reductase activating protein
MDALRVAQVIPRTESEGPGWRFAVWTQGCTLRCRGCCNPEMFPAQGGKLEDAGALAERAAASGVEGVSLLGGEPFEQATGCAAFAKAARGHGLSVMVFSGYTLEELRTRADAVGLLAECDLLVDGRFERDKLDASRRWIGSSNQRLHFMTTHYDPTDPRFRAPQTAELRLARGELVMNGWPSLIPIVSRTKPQ